MKLTELPDWILGEIKAAGPDLNIDTLTKAIAEARADPETGGTGAMERLLTEAKDRRRSGELGGLSETQRYYVQSRPKGEGQLGALSTAAMVNRHKGLKNAGIDPQGSFVRSQRNDETPEQYTAAMQAAKTAYEQRRQAAADKMRAQTEQDKARNAVSGKPWSASATLADPLDKRSEERRAQDATGVMQGWLPPTDDFMAKDASSLIDQGGRGPLPPRQPRYRSLRQTEGGPIVEGIGDEAESADAIAAEGNSDNEAEAIRRALLRQLQASGAGMFS